MNALVRRALDTDVSIASDSARVLESVGAFVATYPAAVAEPTLRYELDVARGVVIRNGEIVESSFEEDWFAPFVEKDLYEQVSARAAPSFVVHAGAVVIRGRAALMFGRSGAGKTTMCRGLIARGARYITDEIAAVDDHLRVRGVPRPLALAPDENNIQHASGYEFVARDGTVVRARFLPLRAERIERSPVPITTVIHLRFAPSEERGPRALRPSEALTALWEQRLRVGTTELEVASELLRTIPSFELITHQVESACRDVDALIGDS